MAALNREWHLAHKMPDRATLEQRIAWHREHRAHCACRDVPASLAKYFEDPAEPAPGGSAKEN